ncbi:unnamed protein product, partial [Mesorhabditis spiculigera]
MTIKKLCCCSLICWCYFLLGIDGFFGLVNTVHYLKIDWLDLRNTTDIFMPTYECLGSLKPLVMVYDISLLFIVILAIGGLLTRKSWPLLPYMVAAAVQMVRNGTFIYLTLRGTPDCDSWLPLLFVETVLSIGAFFVVWGTHHMIRNEYRQVPELPSDFH